jgi:hypothetical protein
LIHSDLAIPDDFAFKTEPAEEFSDNDLIDFVIFSYKHSEVVRLLLCDLFWLPYVCGTIGVRWNFRMFFQWSLQTNREPKRGPLFRLTLNANFATE